MMIVGQGVRLRVCLVATCSGDGAQLGMFEILGLDFVCKAQTELFTYCTKLASVLYLAPGKADGSVSFLEANRDPSWVIDGGAKKVA